jgi:hypothetical protein
MWMDLPWPHSHSCSWCISFLSCGRMEPPILDRFRNADNPGTHPFSGHKRVIGTNPENAATSVLPVAREESQRLSAPDFPEPA